MKRLYWFSKLVKNQDNRVLIYQTVAVSLTYFLSAIISLKYLALDGNATIIWIPSAVALAIMVLIGKRALIGIFIGGFISCIYAGYSMILSILFALGHFLEPLIILSFFTNSDQLYNVRGYLSFIIASIVGVFANVCVLIIALLIIKHIPIDTIMEFGKSAWISHTLSIILLTPLALLSNSYIYFTEIKQRWVELLMLIVISLTIAITVFAGDVINNDHILFDQKFLILIPIIWAILRFNHIVVSMVVVLFFIASTYGVFNYSGVFYSNNISESATMLWSYFFVAATCSMLAIYSISQQYSLPESIRNCPVETYIFNEKYLTFEFVNKAALEKLGVSLKAIPKMTMLDVIPPDSKADFMSMLTSLKNKTQSQICYETTHKRASGSTYPVELHLQRIDQVNSQCYLASIIDITNRITNAQNMLLSDHVCKHTNQAIMITDKDNHIIRVNPAFTAITGYMSKDVIGVVPESLNVNKQVKKAYLKIWLKLQRDGFWKGEAYNQRKSGELYLQQLVIKVLYNDNGDPENYLTMFNDITHERNLSLKHKFMAEHDALTGLSNRIALENNFSFIVRDAKRYSKKFAILFIDLDDFKSVNDNYGHKIGDTVLKLTAQRLQSSVREVDVVARIGGDEFVIIYTDIVNYINCQSLVSKLKKVFEEKVDIDGLSLLLSVSIGVAIYPEDGKSLDALLSKSDTEMYNVKLIEQRKIKF